MIEINIDRRKITSTAERLSLIKEFDLTNKVFVKNRDFIPFKDIDEYLDQFELDFFNVYCKKDTKKIKEIIHNIKNILRKSLESHEKSILDYKINNVFYLFNLSINCILLNCLKKLEKVEDPYLEIFKLIKNCWLLYYSYKRPRTFKEFQSDFVNIIPIYLTLKWYIEDKKIVLNEDFQKKIVLYEEVLNKT